jgi:hypothetical protein
MFFILEKAPSVGYQTSGLWYIRRRVTLQIDRLHRILILIAFTIIRCL